MTVSPSPTEPYIDLDKDGYVDVVVSNYYNGSSYSTDSYIYWGSAVGYTDNSRTALPTVGTLGNAVADLNNDGHLDLVFASYYDGDHNTNSYIYWGDGSRTGFSSSKRTSLFTYGASGVVVADLNRDGYLDIVFANYYDGDNSVPNYIYWGSGTGYNAGNRSELYGNRSRAVDVGDLNNDGYLDLVFASYYDGDYATNSYIYWGSAAGYSALDRSNLYTEGALDVAVVDLNQDGHLDVAFANHYNGNYNRNSYVYWGNGQKDGFSSSNQTQLPTLGAYGVAVADFNRDGHLDLAFANHYNGSSYNLNSYVYWGSSNGYSPTLRLELPTSRATGVLAADLNGDGWTELVFAQYYNEAAGSYNADNRIYWNSPTGFNTTNVSGIAGWHSFGLGAVLPVTEYSNHSFGRVLTPYGQPKADFRVNTGSSVRGTTPLTVTFNNLSSTAGLTISEYLWDFGDGTNSNVISPTYSYSGPAAYTVTLTITTTDGITDVTVKPGYVTVSPSPTEPYVDLDKDGYVDMVVSNYYNGSSHSTDSYIYWGSATGYDETSRTALPTLGSRANAVADLNNDGHLDIVFANHYNGGNYLDSYIYWGDGSRTGFSGSNRTTLKNYRASGVVVADLNRDGYLDIVFANYYDGDTWTPNYIYWGSGTGYSESNRSSLYAHGSIAVDVGDLNEDGFLDLVFAGHHDGDYVTNSYIYWGSAAGYSILDVNSVPTLGALDVAVVDLDEDGHLDIAFANHYNNSNYNIDSYVYWGDGSKSGFSSSHRSNLPTQGAYGVTVADFNQDGHLDLAFANHYNGSNYDLNSYVYWGDGTQTGLSDSRRQLLPTSRATGILAADLNGDGWTELVFAQYYNEAAGSYNADNRIYWNSPTGFNTTNVSGIAGWHSFGLGAVLPVTEYSNHSFGRIVPDLGNQLIARLQVTVPEVIDWLVPVKITATAFNASDEIATNYTGFVELTSSDGASTSFPATHNFEMADQGIFTFTNIVFKTAGPQLLTLSDGVFTHTIPVTVDDTDIIVDVSTTWDETDIVVGTLVVTNGAVLTLKGSTTITAENIIIGEGSGISADGAGYGSTQGPGSGSAWAGYGGGYGGYGGGGAGQPYGSAEKPTQPGSGGYRNSDGPFSYQEGGNGGGVIILNVTNTLTISGAISANGANGAGWTTHGRGGGGGSGGSIWITANTITGSGTIRANGGAAGCGGWGTSHGGAGGRIAIYYGTRSFNQANIQTTGGTGDCSIYHGDYGGPGTIYLKSNGADDRGMLIIDNNGRGAQNAGLIAGDYEFDQLIMQRNGHLTVLGSTSVLTLTTTQLKSDPGLKLTVQGDVATPATFNVYTTTLDVQGELIGAENITLDHGGQLRLQAGAYPGGTLALDNVDVLDGILTLAAYDNNDTNYDNDTGFTLYANNINVAGGSSINANGLGYGLNRGPGASSSGASHGGYGGGNSPTYGSIYTPAALGSSGDNGRGGGALHLVISDTLTLNGDLQANGVNDGSGGSIWIETPILTGTGQLLAAGGAAAGGGGRIAVYATNDDNFGGSTQTDFGGGTCPRTAAAECDGTVYLDSVSPYSSTLIVSPANLVADGVSTGAITVTLKTPTGLPMPAKGVELRVLPETGVFINGQPANGYLAIGTTNLSGTVTAVITATKAEFKSLNARTGEGDTIAQTTVITFTPGPADPDQSFLTLTSGAAATANGLDAVNIRVTARDAFDNPIPGATVVLTSTAPVSFTQPPATDANGQTTGSAAGSQVG